MNTNARPTGATAAAITADQADALADLITKAITEARQAGYATGRYVHSHVGRDEAEGLREEKLAAEADAATAVNRMWAEFFGVTR